MVAITSEYGYWPYVAAVCLFVLLPIIVMAIALGCVVRGAVFQRFVLEPLHLKIVAGLLIFTATSFTTAIAFAESFWVIPTAAAAVLCVLVWCLMLPPTLMLFSDQARYIINPAARSFGALPMMAASLNNAVKVTRGDDTASVEMRSHGTLPRDISDTLLNHNDEAATPGSFFSSLKTPPTRPRDQNVEALPKTRLENVMRCIRDDAIQRKYVYAAALAGGLLTSLLLILFLHNGCVCNKPQVMTTWISRRSEPTFCAADGGACFTYFMIGHNCSSLVAVSHYIEANGFVPSSVKAMVCQGPAADCTASRGYWFEFPGVIRAQADILEDMRHIGHVYLTGLQCGAQYNVQVLFYTPQAAAQASGKVTCVQTMAWNPVQPAGTSGARAFSFIGGGDYVVKSAGLNLLQQAVQAKPDASFAFIGGDLGYDNNMRTCYKRTDRMLREWSTALVRPYGDHCSIPLLSAIGNHDAGGYQWAGASAYSTADGRDANIEFYLKYFPTLSLDTSPAAGVAVPPTSRDWTLTTHAHDLGGVLGWLVLDTGHVQALDTNQALYAREVLQYFRARMQPSAVLYHVPAHPSVRSAEGGNSQDVMNEFVPVFDDYDDIITLVFENHDHSYKRTRRLTKGSIATSAPASYPATRQRTRGVVYTGDGALGAHTGSDDVNMGDIGASQRSTNYVLVADVYTNGSISAQALDESGQDLDRFLAE